jgi:hypothetical protein
MFDDEKKFASDFGPQTALPVNWPFNFSVRIILQVIRKKLLQTPTEHN